jgi:hypothetical protein
VAGPAVVLGERLAARNGPKPAVASDDVQERIYRSNLLIAGFSAVYPTFDSWKSAGFPDPKRDSRVAAAAASVHTPRPGDVRSSVEIYKIPVEAVRVEGDRIWVQTVREVKGEVTRLGKPVPFNRSQILLDPSKIVKQGQRLVAQYSVRVTQEFHRMEMSDELAAQLKVEKKPKPIDHWMVIGRTPLFSQLVHDPADVVSREFREPESLTDLDRALYDNLPPARREGLENEVKDPKSWAFHYLNPMESGPTLEHPWPMSPDEQMAQIVGEENLEALNALPLSEFKRVIHAQIEAYYRKDVARIRVLRERFAMAVLSGDEEGCLEEFRRIYADPVFQKALESVEPSLRPALQKWLDATIEGNPALAEIMLQDFAFNDWESKDGIKLTRIMLEGLAEQAQAYERLGLFKP